MKSEKVERIADLKKKKKRHRAHIIQTMQDKKQVESVIEKQLLDKRQDKWIATAFVVDTGDN